MVAGFKYSTENSVLRVASFCIATGKQHVSQIKRSCVVIFGMEITFYIMNYIEISRTVQLCDPICGGKNAVYKLHLGGTCTLQINS